MPALDPLGASPFFSTTSEISKKKDKKSNSHKVSSSAFAHALEKEQEQPLMAREADTPIEIWGKSFDEALQYLVDSVYSAGDKLKKEPYTEEFKDYKKALSHFMNFIVKNSYEIESHERRNGAKRQVFTLVQVINTKLDELATGILYNQADQLKILAKIEEINGILVDLFS